MASVKHVDYEKDELCSWLNSCMVEMGAPTATNKYGGFSWPNRGYFVCKFPKIKVTSMIMSEVPKELMIYIKGKESKELLKYCKISLDGKKSSK